MSHPNSENKWISSVSQAQNISSKYLNENAGVIDVTLSQEDDEKIRGIIDSVGDTKGER